MKKNPPPEPLTTVSEGTPPEPTPQHENPRVFASDDLFAGRNEVEIQHQGESYRLRITRNGKLILHK